MPKLAPVTSEVAPRTGSGGSACGGKPRVSSSTRSRQGYMSSGGGLSPDLSLDSGRILNLIVTVFRHWGSALPRPLVQPDYLRPRHSELLPLQGHQLLRRQGQRGRDGRARVTHDFELIHEELQLQHPAYASPRLLRSVSRLTSSPFIKRHSMAALNRCQRKCVPSATYGQMGVSTVRNVSAVMNTPVAYRS